MRTLVVASAALLLAAACSTSVDGDEVADQSSAQSDLVGAFPPGQTFGLTRAQVGAATDALRAVYQRSGGTAAVGAPAVGPNTANGYVHPWPNGTCLTQNFHNAASPGDSGALVYSVRGRRAFWLRGQVFKKFTFLTNSSRMGCPVEDEVAEGDGCFRMTFEGPNDDGSPVVRWCGGSDPFYCDFLPDFTGMETTTNGARNCVPIFLPPKRGSFESCGPDLGAGPCFQHPGVCAVDIAGGGEVRAARGGRVEAQRGSTDCQGGCSSGDEACCQRCLNSGNHVVVHHADGSQELYFHLATIAVPNGAQIGPGALVGQAGQSGCAFGPHLHFEARTRGGAAFDPQLCAQIERMVAR